LALHKGFDASTQIPTHMPRGCTFAAGYIGGNTPHVWTRGEWNRFAGTSGVRVFPIWVADFAADPVRSAKDAVAAMRRLGWSPGRALVYDTEDTVDRAWCRAFRHEAAHLQVPVNYGSAAVVARNGDDRLWIAKWDGDPALEGGQDVEAHQYVADVPAAGGVVDFSVMEFRLFRQGGVGPRT
jgi:hypothetical protein